ncbi:polysaccharide biosynthesis tyrosine autokinase [Erythrobacter sp. HKB08]|uniref:GumC family protein n=1 Tax=Erythrobacter sp. HKB08 TaxID=2502843 RepID=UPI00100898CC|nr:polysaccharide biosynthesis tyrosine autokinase [Erythrobacter sp. HKB08]
MSRVETPAAQTPLSVQPPGAPPYAYSYGNPMPTIGIDVRRLASALYRNRFIAAAIIAAALVAGIIFTLSTTPIYQATGTVQIDSQVNEVLDEDATMPPVEWDVERFLQTQLDVLLSRGMAERVVDRLNLTRDDTYFERMGLSAPEVAAPGRTMAETRRAIIAANLQGNVSAELPRYSRVVDIGFTSPDATYASQIANAYIETFIASNLQRKFDSSSYAREYLEQQLELAKDRLEESEKAQVDYARRFGLVDIPDTSERDGAVSIVQTNLAEANAALNAARTARILAEEQYRVAQRSNGFSIPDVQDNAYIQSLQRQRAEISAEMAQDAERYREEHPVMQQHAEKLRGIERQLDRAVSDTRGSLRQRYEAAMRNEQRLAAQVERLQAGTAAEQSERVQYNILSREAATNRAMYDALLQRYKEISASAGVSTNNISLVDRAELPGGPIRPRPLINIGLALFAGLALTGLFIFAREFIDDAARTPDDVTDRLRLPFLGTVPRLESAEHIVEELDRPKSNASESFAALRTSLALLSTEGLRSILVTSSQQGEGKSLVAYGIARSFARAGKRTLIVDTDLRRPSQHQILGTSREKGLTSVITRQASLADVVYEAQDGLHLVPSGPLPPSVPELLASNSFEEFRDLVMNEYDIVIFDGPPVLGLADTVLLAQRIEHLVFVTEAGRATHGRAQAAIRRLRDNDIRVDGAVLNKFDPKTSGYGYNYGYYYSYGEDAA